MKTISMTNPTPINRVRFASPEAADRSFTFGVRGAFYALIQASALKDVASLGSWRPPV